MATLCMVSQNANLLPSSLCASGFQGSSSPFKTAAFGVPARQMRNGELKARASSEDHCSRREAIVAGAAGLAGLSLLLPVGSAEAARTINPGVRNKLRKAIDKLKEEANKSTEVTQKNISDVVKKVAGDKVAKK